jgi:hypothetical protein
MTPVDALGEWFPAVVFGLWGAAAFLSYLAIGCLTKPRDKLRRVPSMNHHEDVILWPDGDWCYRSELEEYAHKADDCEVLKADTPEWRSFLVED